MQIPATAPWDSPLLFSASNVLWVLLADFPDVLVEVLGTIELVILGVTPSE